MPITELRPTGIVSQADTEWQGCQPFARETYKVIFNVDAATVNCLCSVDALKLALHNVLSMTSQAMCAIPTIIQTRHRLVFQNAEVVIVRLSLPIIDFRWGVPSLTMVERWSIFAMLSLMGSTKKLTLG
jgi:hypothetical protein